ncbi:MAG: FGGY-family carbohydrate kinase [Lentisphaerota bacterium]
MYLGLDLGTTNVKALLVTGDGRIACRGSAPIQLIHTAEGGVEQDIEEIRLATLNAIRQAGVDGMLHNVSAVGVSSQGGAMQMLNPAGFPVGRVISWLDGRGRPYNAAITQELGREWFARHTGHSTGGTAVGQLMRLHAERPSSVSDPNRIGFVGDVIVGMLCGRRAHDATSLSIASLYNPYTGSADPGILDKLGINESQLPDLVSAKQPAGMLRSETAMETGLSQGIPVSVAIHDQYASALGSGVTHPDDVMFGAGTAWVLLAVTNRLAAPIVNGAFVCQHIIEDLYGQMLSMGNGGAAFGWIRELMGLSCSSQTELDMIMGRVAPGSEGVRFWPLLATGGGAGLAPATHGRLAGLQSFHRAEHILRAAVEGLSLELARYLNLMTEGGLVARRIVMTGGAAKSTVTPQIIADATGVPVVCKTGSDMSALGAAIVARSLVEPKAYLTDLVEAMTPPANVVEPGPDCAFYRVLFKEYVVSLPAAPKREI